MANTVPRQEVVTLPLAPTLRQTLLNAGFRTVADLTGVGPVDLARGGLYFSSPCTPSEGLLLALHSFQYGYRRALAVTCCARLYGHAGYTELQRQDSLKKDKD